MALTLEMKRCTQIETCRRASVPDSGAIRLKKIRCNYIQAFLSNNAHCPSGQVQKLSLPLPFQCLLRLLAGSLFSTQCIAVQLVLHLWLAFVLFRVLNTIFILLSHLNLISGKSSLYSKSLAKATLWTCSWQIDGASCLFSIFWKWHSVTQPCLVFQSLFHFNLLYLVFHLVCSKRSWGGPRMGFEDQGTNEKT